MVENFSTICGAKIDQCRLNYLKSHQRQICADLYCGLKDAIESNDFTNAGKKIILPASLWKSSIYATKISRCYDGCTR